MLKIALTSVALALALTATAAHAALPLECEADMTLQDEGMWVFNNLPKKTLKDKYGFEVTDAWTEKVMQASVRLNTGGSGSWVSADGLIMTNHHVAAPTLQALSDAEHDYIATGFYAKDRAQEIKAKNLEINQLVSIEDVTNRVLSAVKPGMDATQAKAAKDAMIAQISKESLEKTGLRSDVVTLYLGGQYQLYRYKKYTDVRLVFAPEIDIAFFGGDPDNFEFPRYDLDAAFFRVYDEHGNPVKPAHFFKWNDKGAAEGELVFVSGNPGSTKRLYTSQHMKADRDLMVPASLELLTRRIKNLEAYFKLGAEQKRQAQEDYFGLQNSFKVRVGELEGLKNPKLNLIGKKQADDIKLLKAVKSRPDLKQYATAWNEIAAAEKANQRLFLPVRMLESGWAFDTQLFTYAREIVRLADESLKPDQERLPEYAESKLESLKADITSHDPVYRQYEEFKLADSLRFLTEKMGNDPMVAKILAGRTPEQRAAELVRNSTLASPEAREALVKGGKAAVDASQDPLILLAKAIDGEARQLRKEYEHQVSSPEEIAYQKIAAAKFAIEGASTYPDATFSPRLAFGRVMGYEQDGKQIPSHTTIGGTFDHEKELDPNQPHNQLPKRWHDLKEKLNLETPFNQVSTADIIGGNSGSPVFNKEGEIVGLIFDGNRQSHVARYAYTAGNDNPARALSVHPAAITHTLRVLYNAAPLADELGH